MLSQPYDESYYANYSGGPYERGSHWLDFFDTIAARIVETYKPSTSLDAGCALGFLVEALRKRGVEAYGVDISEYAIGNVHPDIRPFCRVAALIEPLPRQYDLITCIEVLEHVPPQAEAVTIDNLCAHAQAVIFSSTPDGLGDPTHVNVHPPEYWAEQFARRGFYRDLDTDLSYICPWAVRFVKGDLTNLALAREYERKLWQLDRELHQGLSERDAQINEQRQANATLSSELEAIKNSRAWKLAWAAQRLRQSLVPRGSRRERLVKKLTGR